jgi:CubicO group peptidase (beta-lactamase class C family)
MAHEPAFAQFADELRERVAALAGRLRVPGVAAGVTSGEDCTLICHGVTSIENPLPVEEGTFFQIGSTGKTYTATALMMLVERGLVDLAAPVRRYLPDFRVADEAVSAAVTVLQLLNHTAGWDGDFFPDTGYGDDALEKYVVRMAGLEQKDPPGARVSYNNASLSVAGRILEVVTGRPYEYAIRELVLEPARLNEHFYFPWEVITRRVAVGHLLRDGELKSAEWYLPRAMNPQGGASASTVRDQLRYARIHLGIEPGPLSGATLEQMQAPTAETLGGGTFDAIGITWQLRSIDGTAVVAHGGTTLGHESAFELIPERNFGITILTNARHGAELNRAIISWSYESYLGLTETAPEPLALSAEELARYAGVYESHLGRFEVAVEGDLLIGVMTFSPEAVAEILPHGEEIPPMRVPFKILAGDAYLIVDGEHRGERGPIVVSDGYVEGIEVGGRVLRRRA